MLRSNHLGETLGGEMPIEEGNNGGKQPLGLFRHVHIVMALEYTDELRVISSHSLSTGLIYF